jgi:hypothetical protein
MFARGGEPSRACHSERSEESSSEPDCVGCEYHVADRGSQWGFIPSGCDVSFIGERESAGGMRSRRVK